MTVDDATAFALIQEIHAAFADLTPPARENIVAHLYCAGQLDYERLDLIERLDGKTWQSLEDRTLAWCAATLPALTPEAFRYYIAAYLVDVVRETVAGEGYPRWLSDIVVPLLVPVRHGRENELLPDWATRFTAAQSSAVYDFLLFRIPASLKEDDFTLYEGNGALAFWKARAENEHAVDKSPRK